MQTRKLYYEDSDIRTFTARVTGCEPAENGWAVTLDATAFYPEGGGQACDVGSLGNVRVVDVREKEQKLIHLCDGPLEVGSQVEGRLDWQRRLDQMQQHTGEHILSGLIYERFGYHNVGFHVGKEAMEVDFDGPIPAQVLQQLEQQANRIVWEDIVLKCWTPEPEQLPQVAYRTKRELPWPVRIVQVPGCDSCACCGVHVKRTGQVGLIKILSCVKFHQGVRLEMLCGQRAYDHICRIFEENRKVSQAFSAHPLQTGEAALKMNEALSREKLRAAQLQRQLFEQQAARYAGRENALFYAPELTAGQVRELAEILSQKLSGAAVVYSGDDAAGYSLCIVSARQEVRQLGTEAARALQGRGGGKGGAFQGHFRASQQQIEAYFRDFA